MAGVNDITLIVWRLSQDENTSRVPDHDSVGHFLSTAQSYWKMVQLCHLLMVATARARLTALLETELAPVRSWQIVPVSHDRKTGRGSYHRD